jgi:integrase
MNSTPEHGGLDLTNLSKLRALSEALNELFKSPEAPPPRKTINEAGNEYLVGLARSGRSPRFIRTVRLHLTDVFRGKMQRSVSTITPAEIGQTIDTLNRERGWNPVTAVHHLQSTRGFFSALIRFGYCKTNPAQAVPVTRHRSEAPISIHSPEEVRRILHVAQWADLDAMRWLAIAYFAGLRTAEIGRLTESHIRDRYIEVPASISKTRSRRLVVIPPALRAFLNVGGSLPLVSEPKRIKAIRQMAGVAWPRNVARHSFVSYHLAQSGSAARTALEAGHSEAVLFRHYRELVTLEDAEVFWKIAPATEAELAMIPNNNSGIRLVA